MIFRIIIFILILFLIFLGIRGFFSPVQELSQRNNTETFSEYLSGALARNTDTNRYDVIWYAHEFRDMPAQGAYFSSTYPIKPSAQEDEDMWNRKGVYMGVETLSLPQGSLTQSINSATECAGLIFDPCITLWDPIRATGGMNFWSDRI